MRRRMGSKTHPEYNQANPRQPSERSRLIIGTTKPGAGQRKKIQLSKKKKKTEDDGGKKLKKTWHLARKNYNQGKDIISMKLHYQNLFYLINLFCERYSPLYGTTLWHLKI